MSKNDKDVKRYNLGVPDAMFEELKRIADEQDTSILEVIKRFIKLGFIAEKWMHDGKQIIFRDEDGNEKEITLF